MNTQKQIIKWLREHRQDVLAGVCGCVLSIIVHTQVSGLQGYLQDRFLSWREMILLADNAPDENAGFLLPAAHVLPTPLPSEPQPRLDPETRILASSSAASAASVQPRRVVRRVPATLHAAADDTQPVEEKTPVIEAVPEVLPAEEPVPTFASSSSAAASSAAAASSSSAAASSAAAASSSVSSVVPPAPQAPSTFPAFVRAVYPVSRVPNWGAMTKPEEWNRSYDELTAADFVPVPSYVMSKLTVPFASLMNPRNIPEITRKLFYSTHFFSPYDLDAAEFTGVHPGIDLKLALGTPLGAVAGGRVYQVRNNRLLGMHVLIEHRLPSGESFYSVYAHLGSISVSEGQDVSPGTIVGRIGMTGSTSGPHLHLQIDRKTGDGPHAVYQPGSVPSRTEADRWVISPIRFIEAYGGGV